MLMNLHRSGKTRSFVSVFLAWKSARVQHYRGLSSFPSTLCTGSVFIDRGRAQDKQTALRCFLSNVGVFVQSVLLHGLTKHYHILIIFCYGAAIVCSFTIRKVDELFIFHKARGVPVVCSQLFLCQLH